VATSRGAASPVARAHAARRRGDRLFAQRGTADELDALNRAEAEYAKALRVLNLEAYPLEFGTVQAALAAVGARQADLGVLNALERAIAAARLAAFVLDSKHLRARHARLQRLVGGLWTRHAAAQPAVAAAALRAAVEAFEAALAALDQSAPTVERAALLHDLGGALVAWLHAPGDSAPPDPAQALARAIGALVGAAEIQQAQNDSAGLASTFLALGDAYLCVTSADARTRAAECYRRAALYAHATDDRPSFARAQFNLAGVILDGAAQPPAEALQEAAGALRLAGRVYTAAAYPAQHRAVQRNLRIARAKLKGVRP